MSKSAKFANIVLGGVILIFLSMFFYALLRSGAHPPGYMIKYYVTFISGALIFAYVLLRCSVELKARIALLTLSIALCLFVLELILSYNKAGKQGHIRAQLAGERGIAFDSRHRIQVWLDLRHQGIDAYPVYSPYDNMELENIDVLPLGFISGKTTIFCNESGEFILYKSDEHGFNNPEGLYDSTKTDYAIKY
jgi:hypothetical protein